MDNHDHAPRPVLQYRSPTTSNWTRLRVAWLLFLILFGAALLITLSVAVWSSTTGRLND
jgi:hypothetical protein